MLKIYKTHFLTYFTEICLPLEPLILIQIHSLLMIWLSSTTTDIQHVICYFLVVVTSGTIMQPFYFFDKWLFDRKKNQKDDNNKN